jgi:hypothetical protein
VDPSLTTLLSTMSFHLRFDRTFFDALPLAEAETTLTVCGRHEKLTP